jgi:c-di-GMP-binding flagellar brake protein YcgR
MTDKDAEILRKAVARNAGAVLTLPCEGEVRHHKSRLLEQVEEGLLFEAPREDLELLEALAQSGSLVGVSFRNGPLRTIFAVRVIRVEGKFKINEGMEVDAVLLETPAEIRSLQRRKHFRVQVPMKRGITIRVWRLAIGAYFRERPPSAQEVTTELRDLSVGGVGVRFIGKNGEKPTISSEDRLRIELSYDNQKLLMTGMMRPPMHPPTDHIVVAGIQFTKMENNFEGRQTLSELTKLVGELQQEEMRRMRLGVNSAA